MSQPNLLISCADTICDSTVSFLGFFDDICTRCMYADVCSFWAAPIYGRLGVLGSSPTQIWPFLAGKICYFTFWTIYISVSKNLEKLEQTNEQHPKSLVIKLAKDVLCRLRTTIRSEKSHVVNSETLHIDFYIYLAWVPPKTAWVLHLSRITIRKL